MTKKEEDKKLEERYQDYLRFRNENDTLRIQEQGKMDKIIFNCNIGLIGIGFGFMGIIFDKSPTSLTYFCFSILCACLSIMCNYYSSWCSVKDICVSNVKLDEKYLQGEDIHNEIKTPYSNWINSLNNLAMICLSLSVAFFFYFVYANTNFEPKQKENITMTNNKILCEGCEKNKPTTQKPMKNIRISNGVERSKPTVSKNQAQKPTEKK